MLEDKHNIISISRKKITNEIIFCITNEISFTIISLSSSDKFFLDEWKLEIWYKIRNRLTTGSRLQHSFLFFHFINPIYYRSLIFIFFRRLFEDIFWALTYSTNDFGNESRLKTSHRKYSWKCSNWSRITWYILCCSTFSFCSFFRSCNC